MHCRPVAEIVDTDRARDDSLRRRAATELFDGYEMVGREDDCKEVALQHAREGAQADDDAAFHRCDMGDMVLMVNDRAK